MVLFIGEDVDLFSEHFSGQDPQSKKRARKFFLQSTYANKASVGLRLCKK